MKREGGREKTENPNLTNVILNTADGSHKSTDDKVIQIVNELQYGLHIVKLGMLKKRGPKQLEGNVPYRTLKEFTYAKTTSKILTFLYGSFDFAG